MAVNFRAGFRGEPEGRSGLAHLFEHLMFQGSGKVAPGGHFAAVQALGGTVSGNTFTDVADYHQVVPAGYEGRVLKMEADRMENLILDQGRLDVQRRVVLEEINLRVEGAPYGGFPWTSLPSAVYTTWSNRHNGYGEPVELEAVSLDECRDFYTAMYAPGNAVVAVCGDLDPDRALDQAAETFAPLGDRGRPRLPRLTELPADSTDTRARTVRRRDALAPRPALAIGVPLPDAADGEAYAACVVASVCLTGNSWTWLRQAIEARNGQCASVCGLFGPWLAAEPDTFVFVAHHDDGDRETVERLLDEALERLAESSAEEIAPGRAQAYSALTGQQDSVLGVARALSRSALLWDRPDLVSAGVAATATVDDDDVRRAARTLRETRCRGYVELTAGAPA